MVGIARWRLVAAGLYLLVLAGAVFFVWRTGMTLRPQPEFGSASDLERATADAGGEPSPDATASQPVEDPITALRASDEFEEFAGHERAAEARFARLAYENFAPRVDGQRVEWTNKDALWDSLAIPIRDELLQLGPEYRRPLWDNSTAVPNSVAMAWSDESTGHRGSYVEFQGTYFTAGGPRVRYWGFLIGTKSGSGWVVAEMPPLEVQERDFEDSLAAFARIEEVSWEWIVAQPVLESDQ